MRMEMSSLLESVAVSGQHVLLAAQKLGIQPSVTEHREELISATQNVFLGVVKVESNFYVWARVRLDVLCIVLDTFRTESKRGKLSDSKRIKIIVILFFFIFFTRSAAASLSTKKQKFP